MKYAYAAFNTQSIRSERMRFSSAHLNARLDGIRRNKKAALGSRARRALPIGMPLGCFLLNLVISVCLIYTTRVLNKYPTPCRKMKNPTSASAGWSLFVYTFFPATIGSFLAVIRTSTLLLLPFVTCQRRYISLGHHSPTLHALCTLGCFRPFSRLLHF